MVAVDPALVVHDLLADDGLEDQVALEPDARLGERASREGLGDDAALHVGRAAAPDALAVDLPGERAPARPVGRVARRHDVDVAVEDQRPAAARALPHADGVLAPGLDREQVDLAARVPVDRGDEPGHVALAADHLVVDLPGVLGVDALDLDGRRQGLDELASILVDHLHHAVSRVRCLRRHRHRAS